VRVGVGEKFCGVHRILDWVCGVCGVCWWEWWGGGKWVGMEGGGGGEGGEEEEEEEEKRRKQPSSPYLLNQQYHKPTPSYTPTLPL